MSHGERLTEYTNEELQTLLNAVAREYDYLDECLKTESVRAKIEHLEQWKVKIIEAKTEVRVKEIQTEN